MDLRVIGVLLLIPLLDVMLLVALTAYIPLTWVVLLVVLTALLGMLLVRAEGRHTLRKIQKKAARGQPPTDELVDGGLLLVAGALFLTPGLVTDFAALLLALPLTRYPIRVVVKKYVLTPYIDRTTGGFASGNVFVGGFPGEGDGPASGPGAGTGPGPGPDEGSGDGTTIDIGEDEYRNVDDDRPSDT